MNYSNVVLLRPPIISSMFSFSSPITPPLAIAYLCSSLDANGINTMVVDAVGEAIGQVKIYKDPECRVIGLTNEQIIQKIPDKIEFICISCMFSQEWFYIKKLINQIGNIFTKAIIVVGGEHITAMPEFVLKECSCIDVCAIGEGEKTIVEIVKRFHEEPGKIKGIYYRGENENVVFTGIRERIKDLDSIPRPAWNKLPIESYLSSGYGHGINRGRTMPILATRGCPYQCTFCSNKLMWTQRYHVRSVGDVMDEISNYVEKYRIDNIDFYDLTAFVRKMWIVEFCTFYKRRKLSFSWSLPSGTRSEALDDEVTKLIGETNCRYLVYAAESGSERILTYIKKKVKLEKMLISMREAKNNKISLRCNLMIGFPKETNRDVLKTLIFQIKLAFLGVDDCPIYMFSPYPGSELFNYLKISGRIGSLNDEYFRSLLCQMDLTHSKSYCENISSRVLSVYRFVGMSLFYLLSYLLYPSRIFRSIKNIFISRITNTVFEQRIVEALTTLKKISE